MEHGEPIERVLLLAPGPGNPRNSEGDFIRLQDGRLLFVYTHFTGSAHDDAEAFLAARVSEDGGRTWSAEDMELVREPDGRNVMSVSLLRLGNGRIGLFYLRKNSCTDWCVLMRTSSDEGRTWTDASPCSHGPGLYVINNDRAVRLQSGRIVLPVAYRTPEEGRGHPEELIACLLSDNDGVSWRRSRHGRRVPGVWTQEPGVIELRDGRLWMLCRTQVGCQYACVSGDGGDTWSELTPSEIISPLSPACVKRIPATGDLLLVWNHVAGPWPGWDALQRSPLNAAVSRDEGETWQDVKVLEQDPARWFCYTAIHFTPSHAVLGYTAGTGSGPERMDTLRIARVPLEWIYTT